MTYYVSLETQNKLNDLARSRTGLGFYSGLVSILRGGSFRIIHYGKNFQQESELVLAPFGVFFIVDSERKEVRLKEGEFINPDPRLLELLKDVEASLLGLNTPGHEIALEPTGPATQGL